MKFTPVIALLLASSANAITLESLMRLKDGPAAAQPAATAAPANPAPAAPAPAPAAPA